MYRIAHRTRPILSPDAATQDPDDIRERLFPLRAGFRNDHISFEGPKLHIPVEQTIVFIGLLGCAVSPQT
jgi:hypothetical protein